MSSVTKKLEDNWEWYNKVKGKNIPKTILGKNIKNIKQLEKEIGKDYIVKSRLGWGNRGIVTSKDFVKKPKKYLTKDFIIQKKEPLHREYRATVIEGETVNVLPRSIKKSGIEFVNTPTPRLAKEKDRIARHAENIVSRMGKDYKNEIHNLGMAVTKGGRVVAWEDNAAQGGTCF